jgi:hypothetical protein
MLVVSDIKISRILLDRRVTQVGLSNSQLVTLESRV